MKRILIAALALAAGSAAFAAAAPKTALVEDFSREPLGSLPDGFKTTRFPSVLDAPFVIGKSGAEHVLSEHGGKGGNVLYYVPAAPLASLRESYAFTYMGPASIVEPFMVNATKGAQLEGFGVNFSESMPRNDGSGNVYYEYSAGGSPAPLKAVKGRLRTEPYFYAPGHTYRVEAIADPRTQVLSARVYDVRLGPQAFDTSIRVLSHAVGLYPGLTAPYGGPIAVTDFSFGPMDAPPIRANPARRAYDYQHYLGFNAAVRGGLDAPASLAFVKYFPALGISHVRIPDGTAFLPSINAVARFGIDADVLTSNRTTVAGLQSFMRALARKPDAIELWNEPNNSSEGSAYDPKYAADLPGFARQLAAAFPNTTIWGPSFLPDRDGYPSAAKRMAGSLTGTIAGWNSHPYALDTPENMGYGGFISGACGPSLNEDCGWYGSPYWNDNESAVLAPALPGIASEGAASYGSYPAICGHTNVDFETQQAYVQRGMLYGFKMGHVRIFPYKFIDDRKCSDGFGTFGLLSQIKLADGTLEFTPKPAYTALAYFDRLLRDDGPDAATFQSLPLAYAIAGATPATEELLLAHSDGSYRLIVWSDAKLWDFNANGLHAAGAELPPASIEATVLLGKKAHVVRFEQHLGTGMWKATDAGTSVTSVPVSITGAPLVLDIRPFDARRATARKLEVGSGIATPGPIETP